MFFWFKQGQAVAIIESNISLEVIKKVPSGRKSVDTKFESENVKLRIILDVKGVLSIPGIDGTPPCAELVDILYARIISEMAVSLIDLAADLQHLFCVNLESALFALKQIYMQLIEHLYHLINY